jgi:hypothetical protein
VSLNAKNTKGHQSICFKLLSVVAAVANIASFCCTRNHWSDDVTSRAYVTDVAAPYFKRKIEALRTADPSLCKPYGEQVCVLIVDCWYGWIDAGFKEWLACKYVPVDPPPLRARLLHTCGAADGRRHHRQDQGLAAQALRRVGRLPDPGAAQEGHKAGGDQGAG